MAEVLLLHHAQGLTEGCLALAEDLRAAGHVVHAPDLYDGRTFATLDEGIAHAGTIGFGTIIERGARAAAELPAELVYVGLSLGVLPAQMLAQTRPGARGAVLAHACIPFGEFGSAWPEGVPAQIHLAADDPVAAEDLVAARELVVAAPSVELFLYPGDAHLFTDRSLGDYDEAAATLVRERMLALL